jgi:S1-C subfamily serine protease
VRTTAEQIIKNGKVEHGYLGISMNDVTPENAQLLQSAGCEWRDCCAGDARFSGKPRRFAERRRDHAR